MAPLLCNSLCGGPSTGTGASTQAELQHLFLSTLLPYFVSPQAVLSFPAATGAYLAGVRSCIGAKAAWEPIEQVLAAVSAAMGQAFTSRGRNRWALAAPFS